MNTLLYAVKKDSQMAAADTISVFLGTGRAFVGKNSNAYAESVHRRVLGVATASQNTTYLVTHLEARSSIRHLHDRSRALQTRNVTGSLGRRIHSLTLPLMHTKETCLDDVGTVDGAGRDLDQKLSLLRLGNITRHDLHHLPFQSCENNYLGRSVLGNVHALHRRGNGGEAAHNA
jgi:hypothetical protein